MSVLKQEKLISDKQARRNHEKLVFQREMFWHEKEKQDLIVRLLQKIYDLEDELEIIKTKM